VQLTFADWAVVGLFFLLNLAIGFYYKSRAQSSVDEFFLSGDQSGRIRAQRNY
jgi:solute:Na+ symporter, SSS family